MYIGVKSVFHDGPKIQRRTIRPRRAVDKRSGRFLRRALRRAGEELIRAALDFFIQDRLVREPEVRKRFEEARKNRLGAAGGSNIKVMPTSK